MRAAWDKHLPRETEAQQRELVDFAADCGFDTLAVHQVTPTMAERGRERGLRTVEIIGPYPDAEVADTHGIRQELTDVESAVAAALSDLPEDYQRSAHLWYPLVLTVNPVCFESEAAMCSLERQISEALELADGVALDGFGYRNYYACHCDRCVGRRREYIAETGSSRYDALAHVSEEILVEAVDRLYRHAKTEVSDALVLNHVWPPFRPNPDYGHRLPLDYCSQTISWFYPPDRPLDRVAFEARRHARLAGSHNAFAPFVGLFDEPYLLRGPERLARELEIALDHGDGNLVFSSLAPPFNHGELESVLADALAQ